MYLNNVNLIATEQINEITYCMIQRLNVVKTIVTTNGDDLGNVDLIGICNKLSEDLEILKEAIKLLEK